jgi:hypothetical protein
MLSDCYTLKSTILSTSTKKIISAKKTVYHITYSHNEQMKQKLLHGCHVHFADRELKRYEDKMASGTIILIQTSTTNSK